MERLEYLARQFNGESLTPIITLDEYIKYIKQHKEELKPVVNKQINVCTNDGYPTSFSCLLCMSAFFKNIDLITFIVNEFRDTIDVNVRYKWHGMVFYPKIRSIEFPGLHVFLSSYPSFDINCAIHAWDELFIKDGEILERIMARANPHKLAQEKHLPLLRKHPVLHKYILDPIKTQRLLYSKYYGEKDACRVFILVLLLDNKYLCCA